MLRYAIVDATIAPGHAARLAAAGVDYVQLRAKSLQAAELLALARVIMAEIHGTPTKLLINGRADVALAAHAHGVHLTSGAGELIPQQIHQLFTARPATVSVSCHTVEEVAGAREGGADLILFGPVFEKRVAQQFITDGSGLTALADAVKAAAGTPVLALGGITHENTDRCVAAGAAGIAAIRLFNE